MNFTRATVDDFLLAFDDFETYTLSSLDSLDPDVKNIHIATYDRIRMGLEDAEGIILSYYIRCTTSGQAAIQSAYRGFQLRIARYLLDTLKGRQSVTDSYKEVILQLEKIVELKDIRGIGRDKIDQLGLTDITSQTISAIPTKENITFPRQRNRNLLYI
jgi:phage gp36-like protein